MSKQEVSKNQRVSALNDLTKLLESVKAQEKNMVETDFHLIVIIIVGISWFNNFFKHN